MEQTPTYYPIYSLSLANYLVRQGHNIVKVGDNQDKPHLKKFLFYDGPKLQSDITQFTNMRRNENNTKNYSY